MGSSRIVHRVAVCGLAAAGLVALFAACGTNATGIQQCRDIEDARCNRAAACKISLALPLHEGSDVDSCIRFYGDQCLHGLVTTQVPGGPAVSACIAAINTDCALVADPTLGSSDAGGNPCGFLIPGVDAAVDDAGTDADAAEDADDAG